MKDGTEKKFWSFFLQLYNKEGIEAACLALQNKYHLNVNLLLFSCWAALQNYAPISTKHWKTILSHTTPWHDNIVSQLEGLTKSFKHRKLDKPLTELYRLIVSSAIFAVQAEQSLILQSLDKLDKVPASEHHAANSATTNIFNYIKTINKAIHKNDLEKIYRIVKRCFE